MLLFMQFLHHLCSSQHPITWRLPTSFVFLLPHLVAVHSSRYVTIQNLRNLISLWIRLLQATFSTDDKGLVFKEFYLWWEVYQTYLHKWRNRVIGPKDCDVCFFFSPKFLDLNLIEISGNLFKKFDPLVKFNLIQQNFYYHLLYAMSCSKQTYVNKTQSVSSKPTPHRHEDYHCTILWYVP